MCNKVSLNIAKFAAGEKLTAVTLRQHVAPKLARVGMFSDRLIANFQLSAFRVPEKVAYPVLVEGRVHQQIHIPEYPVAVRCKFPMLAENTPSPSKTHQMHPLMRRIFWEKTLLDAVDIQSGPKKLAQ